MGGACSTYGRGDVNRVVVGKRDGKRPPIRRRRRRDKILKCISTIQDVGADLIDLGEDKDGWRNLEKTAMKLQVA